MKIPSQSILSDYRALRGAASQGNPETFLEGIQQSVELLDSRIDQDPATPDHIVVSAWNGAFSGPGSAPAKLTYRETQQDGKPILEFSASQPVSNMDPTVQNSQATIDMETGLIMSSGGTGNYLVQYDIPTPAICPKPTEKDAQQARAIRATHSELKQLLSEKPVPVGSDFFVESLDKEVSLVKSEPGLIEISYWGGAFSGPEAGTYTETFREYREDGRDMLAYVQVNTGDPMNPGSGSTVSRNLPL